MRPIYDFSNYREYLAAVIEANPERSYGFKLRLAEAIGVSSSLISQIFKGQKTLSADQASDLCDFLGMNELESDYFHLLVELDRSGNQRYRAKLERKLQVLRKQSLDLGKRVPRTKELSDEQKAIYYSSWLYTGIRNLSAVPEIDSAETIAEYLHLDLRVVKRVLEFLLQNKLCQSKAGKITYGPAATHVDAISPFVNKHHQNWRFRAIQEMENKRESDLFFTSPMSLSHEAFAEIRSLLPQFIERIMKVSSPSPSETVACINMDWFAY